MFVFGGWKDALSGISGEFTFQVFNVKAKAVDSIALTDGLTVATIFDEEIKNVSVSYYSQTCTNSHLGFNYWSPATSGHFKTLQA